MNRNFADRHYGLDWLRIGAFALLIFYHVGMVFVPWGFHVKTANPIDWVAIPMLATNSWRLLLLFVVSGYATRALLAKDRALGRFAWGRTLRLGIPLTFAVIVVVPLQPWVELTTQHGYAQGFWYFLANDYFRFGTLADIVLPTWQHLWFVVYLLVYTLLLALFLLLPGTRVAQTGFDRVFGTVAIWVLPTLWLAGAAMYLFPGVRETHALADDWVAHTQYLPAFVFGFALAGSPAAFAAIRRWWVPALLVAVTSYIAIALIEWRWPGGTMPHPYGLIFSGGRALQGWSMIVALIGIADRYWNRDHPWRAVLTEAVFPFYIIHQTIIVGVEGALLPFGLHPAVEFVILVVATVIGCWAFYLAGREVGWLRPLIGLRTRVRPAGRSDTGLHPSDRSCPCA